LVDKQYVLGQSLITGETDTDGVTLIVGVGVGVVSTHNPKFITFTGGGAIIELSHAHILITCNGPNGKFNSLP
jgi:hypothetical protein